MNPFRIIKWALSLCILLTTPFLKNGYSNSLTSNADQLIAQWKNDQKKISPNRTEIPINKWKELFETTYIKAVAEKDTLLQFKLSYGLATIYHDLTNFKKGLPILEYLHKNKERLSDAEYRMVLIKLEEEYRATNNIAKAIAIRKERISKNFIHTYWEIYRDCGLYEAAKIDFLLFEPIPEKFSKRKLYYKSFLGSILLEMNQVDSARKIYNEGIAEATQAIEENKINHTQRQEDLVYWHANLVGLSAKCDMLQGKYDHVIERLLFNLKNTGDNNDNKIEVYILLAKAYLHSNDFEKSKLALDNAKLLMADKTLKNIKSDYLITTSNYFEAIKMPDSAFFYLRSYNNYNQELQYNIQKNQSILLLAEMEISDRRKELLSSQSDLQKISQLTKTQRTQLIWLIICLAGTIIFGIALYFNIRLKNKNRRQILAQNEQLKINAKNIADQNKHNEILLKELHHRVKNNLQVMYSLLNLQKRRNNDEELKETLSSVQNRIQTMALVHQNLYNSGDFERVDVTNYIKTLVLHLQSIYKIDTQNVNIEFDIETSLSLDIDKIIPVGLLINEAVSNAFKHAFKKASNGILQVSIEQVNDNLIIEITDNGPGFNEIDIKETSIGMQLIKIMCTQLNAHYRLSQVQGVSHKIEFKI